MPPAGPCSSSPKITGSLFPLGPEVRPCDQRLEKRLHDRARPYRAWAARGAGPRRKGRGSLHKLWPHTGKSRLWSPSAAKPQAQSSWLRL